ncbi:MAG: ABC transporter substrate-binding protein [Legionellaceae bacterium]|nr:ABC transporter substrate-binding protein [Legionellaceae bacterium]
MGIKKIGALILVIVVIVTISLFSRSKQSNLPLIAIANLGPHSSLDASIQGIKNELTKNGFIEQENIQYEIVDVGFDASLIPQMITSIKNHHPRVLVTITTPVAQYAKGTIKDIPLIYSVITDPVAAGLIQKSHQPEGNMTGSSDKQDLNLLLDFTKQVLDHPSRIGILYSTAEGNDLALVHMLKQAALTSHMQVVSVPIDQTRDIPMAMQQFNQKVDFIYVGGSGAIQPALPVIASESSKMGIPIFNVNEAAVKENMVLASFGVNYHQVGVNAGKLIVGILQGKSIASLPPQYPSTKDYQGFVSQKNAAKLGLHLPVNLPNTIVVK